MESPSLPLRALSALNRLIRRSLFRARQLLASLVQVVQRDQLRELTDEARVLGSASAESIDHVGAELREINARLAELERQLERIASRIEDGGATGRADESSEAPAQPLPTE